MAFDHCFCLLHSLLFLLVILRSAHASGGAASVVLAGQEIGVEWLVDFPSETILFTVRAPLYDNNSWVLLGFSDHGEFNVSDFCLFDVESGVLWDGFINSRLEMSRDRQQDCGFIRADDTSFSFRRRFHTCDPKDFAMEGGTSQMFVSRSELPTSNFSSPSVFTDKMFTRLLARDASSLAARHSPESFTLHITAKNVQVPSQVTTWWCVIQRLNSSIIHKKHHIISEFSGSCNDPMKPAEAKKCSKSIGLLTMGGGAVIYPEEAGFPFGGPDFNPWVMLEIHYNNVAKTVGLVDSSGFDVIVTPKLRRNDAGILEIGMIFGDANSIPPNQKRFAMSGYCTADCTGYFPESGLNVFKSQLHSHLTTRKMWQSLYRDGVRVREINRDNHYSEHWQHLDTIRPVIKFMPGDVITTTCLFDTTKRSGVVLGGYGIMDEMCVAFTYYYPAIDLEECKSAVNNDTLHRFFRDKGVKTSSLSIAEKYRAVEWDEENVRDLAELFAVSPLNMQCMRTDESTFPGHPTNWTKIEMPQLKFGAGKSERARFESGGPCNFVLSSYLQDFCILNCSIFNLIILIDSSFNLLALIPFCHFSPCLDSSFCRVIQNYSRYVIVVVNC